MADREKVEKALDCRANDSELDCRDCAYYIREDTPAYCNFRQILRDALALLKEQDAVEPRTKPSGGWVRTIKLWYCGACHSKISRRTSKYCPNCGKPILWEGR